MALSLNKPKLDNLTNLGRHVPEELHNLLVSAFAVIDDRCVDELLAFAAQLYELAYATRLKDRTPEDNRPEHELVVLRNTLRISWRSGAERDSGLPFDRSELRVAVASALLHDLRFIPRIQEEAIKEAEDRGDLAQARELRDGKAGQRAEHLRGSAEDALNLICSVPGLMTDAETRQCVGYIGLHDLWKLGWPYPAGSDWLAVCCFEGDALWPLDPAFGPLADLERKGLWKPSFDQLRAQAKSNLDTQLRAFRASFAATAERFQDSETVIRTTEGARMLQELRAYWGISTTP